MSRRASLCQRAEKGLAICPEEQKRTSRVRFPDELVFLDDIKENDLLAAKAMLRRASIKIDINAIGDSGMTPLHQAVVDGNDDAVRLLVSNGCDINRQDTDTWTPLHTACACGHAEIVRYLLENGADASILTEDGERPIDLIEPDDMTTVSVVLQHRTSRTIDQDDNDQGADIDCSSSARPVCR